MAKTKSKKKGAAKEAAPPEQQAKSSTEEVEPAAAAPAGPSAAAATAPSSGEVTSVSALLSSLWASSSTEKAATEQLGTSGSDSTKAKKAKGGTTPAPGKTDVGTKHDKQDDDGDDDEAAGSAPLSETFSRLFANSQQPKPTLVVGKTIKAKEKKTGEEGKAGQKAASEKVPKKPKLTPEERAEQEERTLFLGNVPLDWDEKALRRKLKDLVGEKYTGTFKPIRFRSVPVKDKWQFRMRKIGSNIKDFADDSADSKSAYVVLKSPDAVDVVRLATHGIRADDRHILRADAVGQSSKLQTFDRKRSVCVGNLPPNVTEADLREAFEEAGEIHAVRIVRDKVTQKCRGVAFILFRERAHVKTALTYHNTFACKRWIRVSRVEVREESDRPVNLDEKHPAERRHEGKYPWSPDYKKESGNKEEGDAEDSATPSKKKHQDETGSIAWEASTGKGKAKGKGKGKDIGKGKGKSKESGEGFGWKRDNRKGDRKGKGKGKGKDKGTPERRRNDDTFAPRTKGEKRQGDSQGIETKERKRPKV